MKRADEQRLCVTFMFSTRWMFEATISNSLWTTQLQNTVMNKTLKELTELNAITEVKSTW